MIIYHFPFWCACRGWLLTAYQSHKTVLKGTTRVFNSSRAMLVFLSFSGSAGIRRCAPLKSCLSATREKHQLKSRDDSRPDFFAVTIPKEAILGCGCYQWSDLSVAWWTINGANSLTVRRRPDFRLREGLSIIKKDALSPSVLLSCSRALASNATGLKHSIPLSHDRAIIASALLLKMGIQSWPSSSTANQSPFARRIP